MFSTASILGKNKSLIIPSKFKGLLLAYLLNNYPGASAAYSLEKINSSYTGGVVNARRRDNTEQVIYPANYATDLKAFCACYLDGSRLVVNGPDSGYARTPNDPSFDITGDIDIRCEYETEDIDYLAVLVSRWFSPIVNSYLLRQEADGTLGFARVEEGRVQVITSTVALPDGNRKWVRATLDADNGSNQHEVKFYTSTDGSTWTQLGATITNSGVASIDVSTAELYVGARGGSPPITHAKGKIYRAIIKDGIDGTTVFDADFSAQTADTTSFTESTGKTVTIEDTGKAYCQTWYDQSGNERNATQATAAGQPLLYDGTNGGVVLENGKPALDFDGVDDWLNATDAIAGYPRLDAFILKSGTDMGYILISSDSNNYGFAAADGSGSGVFYENFGNPSLYANGILQNVNNKGDVSLAQYGYKLLTYENAATSGWGDSQIGNLGTGGVWIFDGKLQELLLYPSDQSANRAAIEADINSRYSIY